MLRTVRRGFSRAATRSKRGACSVLKTGIRKINDSKQEGNMVRTRKTGVLKSNDSNGSNDSISNSPSGKRIVEAGHPVWDTRSGTPGLGHPVWDTRLDRGAIIEIVKRFGCICC
ncbi:hypothetical protein E2P81_ATG04237 [Venturia nashicola]|uniref:Uncharacterized protein n=1 Tax=Venturia nashicola TaxID=86259 RepID=A0A4Z1P7L8_9PEZI|nr:hypothetical protein E6O75_ATG04338 [Venturia nashicola]TLD37425.1 hypothetical protein E2P81_ATG04237 [Venturia nashicola]